MNSIRYIDNGKGGTEAVPLKSTRGLELRNANGDVAPGSTGYQIAIDTLTYIRKQVTEQKFYEFDIPELVPMTVGEGAFSQQILTNLSFSTSGDFEEGNINTAGSSSKIAESNASLAPKYQAVRNWAKQISYTTIDIEQAIQANNWDRIMALHRARKKDWDLGIQKIALVGSGTDNTNFPGLLTLSNATVDTTTLTASISSLNPTDFQTFVSAVVGNYFANTNSTVLPNRFVIPMSDYLGLAAATSSTYPINSKLAYLEQVFQTMCPGLKIVPNSYCDKANNKTVLNVGTGYQMYALYKHDIESLAMHIPVDFTTTQPNSINNFQFQDAAYGQYTGVGLFRNLEMYYMRF
jgi:hypothetical protein